MPFRDEDIFLSQEKLHVRNALKGVAGKALGAEWRVLGQLLKNWAAIVGPEMAAHMTPSGITSHPRPDGREEARLSITIPGALAPQAQMMEKTMLERINQTLGYRLVSRITFEHKVGDSSQFQK